MRDGSFYARAAGRRAYRAVACVLAAQLSVAGCGPYRAPLPADVMSKSSKAQSRRPTADLESLAAFEAPEDELYRIGRGDRLTVEVWGRPELTSSQVVGPDGVATLPLTGPQHLEELTREAAAEQVRASYARYYVEPTVTVRVDDYASNRIFILGRVAISGALRFDSPITLLEALSRAGSLPVGAGSEIATLNRCAVFRGRDKAVWVDLEPLLSGREPRANIRLHRNDVVYLPDSDDQTVLVMGEILKPGGYRITPGMRILDAIGKAGGPTKDAAKGSIRFIRPSQKLDVALDLEDLMIQHIETNVVLEEGDILYLPRSGIANIGYVLQQISGVLTVLLLSSALTGNNSSTTGTSGTSGNGVPRP
jgi:polysaccharide biosynthesis/export protein